MRIGVTSLLLAVMGLIAADDAKKTGDLTAFRGNWAIRSLIIDGRAAPEDLIRNFRCHFEEKTYKNLISKDIIEDGDYTIEPSQSPSSIDFDIKSGPKKGKKQLGIYKVDSGKITLVMTQAGSKTRPKSFKAEPGDSLVEVVLIRVKP